MRETDGFIERVVADGRPLLNLTAMSLFFAGALALFLSATGQFLPHDIAFLQISADELCVVADCRIVAFMFHDRVAFAGALLAIAILYLWLVAFPLENGEAWAWWTLALSGALGFMSFLGYLAYGYLDTWHGVGTLFLLPCFVLGLALSYRRLRTPHTLRDLARTKEVRPHARLYRTGRWLFLATAAGMVAAGLMILVVGMTRVFVREDLEFIGLNREYLSTVNPRLVPLIAHDRAGFGGGLAVTGIIVAMCVYYAKPSRSLWQALAFAGIAGFGCAIGVHFAVRYTDVWHLGPAVAGAMLFAAGVLSWYRPLMLALDEAPHHDEVQEKGAGLPVEVPRRSW